MKKVILAILVLATFGAKAQEGYKKFKVDASLGYAIPSGSGAKTGAIFTIEPKYAVLPNVSVGLRLESAIMANSTTYTTNQTSFDLSVKAMNSYVVTADYYLSDKRSFRPFVGGGLGLFRTAGIQINSNNSIDNTSYGNKFGGIIRGGFEAGHFRLGLEYNLVGKTNALAYNGSKVGETKNNYLGIKVGFCISGGKK